MTSTGGQGLKLGVRMKSRPRSKLQFTVAQRASFSAHDIVPHMTP